MKVAHILREVTVKTEYQDLIITLNDQEAIDLYNAVQFVSDNNNTVYDFSKFLADYLTNHSDNNYPKQTVINSNKE